MFSPALIIANAKIDDLIAEASANRLAAQARSPRRSRVTAALAGVRSILGTKVDTPIALPKLSDYPYRS